MHFHISISQNDFNRIEESKYLKRSFKIWILTWWNCWIFECAVSTFKLYYPYQICMPLKTYSDANCVRKILTRRIWYRSFSVTDEKINIAILIHMKQKLARKQTTSNHQFHNSFFYGHKHLQVIQISFTHLVIYSIYKITIISPLFTKNPT